MEKELLLALAEKTGCMYLSDLKFIQDKSRIKSALQHFEAHDFSLQQWNGAVEYLTEQKKEFTSPNEAKKFLLDVDFVTCQRA